MTRGLYHAFKNYICSDLTTGYSWGHFHFWAFLNNWRNVRGQTHTHRGFTLSWGSWGHITLALSSPRLLPHPQLWGCNLSSTLGASRLPSPLFLVQTYLPPTPPPNNLTTLRVLFWVVFWHLHMEIICHELYVAWVCLLYRWWESQTDKSVMSCFSSFHFPKVTLLEIIYKL